MFIMNKEFGSSYLYKFIIYIYYAWLNISDGIHLSLLAQLYRDN